PLGRGRQGHPDLVDRSDRRRLVPGWADRPRLPAERAETGMTGHGARAVEPVAGPLDATVVVPGSKSVTNRALVCAGLAGGGSTLTGALVADDTEAMVDCLRRLGIAVAAVDGGTTLVVEGCGGSIPATRARLDVGGSGTTARFVAPVAALGTGRFVLDGSPRMRERPLPDLVAAPPALDVTRSVQPPPP